MVFLYQRTAAALSEPALSAGLQHRSAILFLGAAFGLAVSLEHVFAGGGQAFFQAGGSRRQDAPAGAVLGGIRAGVFHFFHHARILFDAVLSRVGAVAGFGHGAGRRVVAAGNSRHRRAGRDRGAGDRYHICIAVMHVPTPGDISTALSSHPKAYTLSLGHIEDLTLEFVRVSAVAVAGGGDRLSDRDAGDDSLRPASARTLPRR